MSISAQSAWASVRPIINFAELARALGISRSSISEWNHVPESRVQAVSDATRIPVHELRPDIYAQPDNRPWNETRDT